MKFLNIALNIYVTPENRPFQPQAKPLLLHRSRGFTKKGRLSS